MRFQKIYLEISNVCNLSCAFCPGTRRTKHFMTVEEFTSLTGKLRPYSDFLYFHLMGEPLLHPHLEDFLRIAGDLGFKVILTTNGTLLPRVQSMLLNAPALHKVNISLHAFEANDLTVPFHEYLRGCFQFGKAAEGQKLVVYRLWNNGGADALNQNILESLASWFPEPWTPNRQGQRIGEKVFLEYGDKFDWPDLSAPEGSGCISGYGLRDQRGFLGDGPVVPGCLDHEGDLSLGNLHNQTMEDILASHRAQSIYRGFTKKEAAEELCRKCGYARRFR